MKNSSISSYSELLLRQTELKTLKVFQEEALVSQFKVLFSSLNLVSIFKKVGVTSGFITNNIMQMGLNLLLGWVVGKHRSTMGYLASMLIERILLRFFNK